ncbi:MAG: polyphenol oxidase family protein [Leptospiraceae bacterium]|nr:polyphenol oxidase family protein [Leptospiraceae bacterium]
MIQKEIQTNFSKKIHFSVWGKEETKDLEGIPKEKLSNSIQSLVSQKIGIATNKIFILEQVHGDTFYNTKDLNAQDRIEGDALYSNQTGEVLVVKTADCMPLFFWSEVEQLIGVIHSGWKGTELGISEKLFLHLHSQGYSLDSIHTFLGPCARKKNYEVGEDLFIKFQSYAPDAIEPKDNHKYLLGIDIVLRQRLLENKIPIEFIDSEICTIEDTSYYSHRCGDKGRNLNLIWMT